MDATDIPLWARTAAEPEPQGGALVTERVDVAIVGGGYTGLSTALHAAENGLSAQVVEAGRIGQGGSGRNAGLVNASAWLPPAKIRQTLGPRYGPRFVERFGAGPARVFEMIEKHAIACEPTRTGTVHAAHSPRGMNGLRDRHAQWQALGQPVDLLDRDAVAELIGSRAYHGGLVDHRAGTINPMGYARGLARVAGAAGASIATETRATGLVRDGADWIVQTTRGEIRAGAVVLGTNAYTDGLWPGLKRIYTPIHFLQLATPPLGPEAAHILPGRQGLWDTAPVMFEYRRDADGRLLVGTMGRVIGSHERGLTRRWAAKRIARVFPELGPVTFTHAWHGRLAMTPDHMPRIYRLAPSLWTTIGYNGRGIITGTLFGEMLAGLLTGADPADLPLPVTDMKPAPGARLKAGILDLAFTANQVWGAI